jgi:hypothetical protein
LRGYNGNNIEKRFPVALRTCLPALVALAKVVVESRAETEKLWVDFSGQPVPVDAYASDVVVLDTKTSLDYSACLALGKRLVARLSLLEPAGDLPVIELPENCAVLDFRSPLWLPHVTESLARRAPRHGFNGLLLDARDDLDQLRMAQPGLAEQALAALAAAAESIRGRYSNTFLMVAGDDKALLGPLGKGSMQSCASAPLMPRQCAPCLRMVTGFTRWIAPHRVNRRISTPPWQWRPA